MGTGQRLGRHPVGADYSSALAGRHAGARGEGHRVNGWLH
jgi:hypothetical protein